MEDGRDSDIDSSTFNSIGLGVIYPGFPVLQLVQQSWLTIDGGIDVAWYSKFLGLKIS